MNKRIVESLLPRAYYVLAERGIAQGNCIDRAFWGQITILGAAIQNGSLLAAIAFFSDDGGCVVERSRLLLAVADLIHAPAENLFDYVNQHNTPETKEAFLHAVIALKLSIGRYQQI